MIRAQFTLFSRHLGSAPRVCAPRVCSCLIIIFIGLLPAFGFADKPSTNSPTRPVTSKTRQEVKKPLANFQVNPLIRLKNSKFQVLAGRKEPNSAIYINDQEVIPPNSYNSWYYEYPLNGNSANITVGMAFVPKKQVAKASPKGATPLNVEPPVITGSKLDPQTKDFILTIQDPPGVAAYNIYYADSLDKTAATNPFSLAQSNYPVSGTGTTQWRDNGTYTKSPPLGPGIKMRFYKLEIAKINFQFTSITPEDNFTFLAGARINIQAKAVHPNNDTLQYQFSIGGKVVQPWFSSDTFLWQTSSSDTGTVSLTCEAKDTKGAQISKTITYRIVNSTLEEILQKVADNYGLVNDKRMDVTMSSKFNNEPFGETTHTRHYFAKPDKQRTETFENAQRIDSAMTEIHIVNGLDTYLIDPKTKAKAQSNILSEANTTQEQLNQMDEVYHLSEFLKAHTITRIDNPDDLAKGLVSFEAIPKTAHEFYSKLGLEINYFKGLKTKLLTYIKENNQDKLKQALETTDSIMLSGCWVPAKQVKILYLSDGNLVMNYNFENIQLNRGLTDWLFDPERQ